MIIIRQGCETCIRPVQRKILRKQISSNGNSHFFFLCLCAKMFALCWTFSVGLSKLDSRYPEEHFENCNFLWKSFFQKYWTQQKVVWTFEKFFWSFGDNFLSGLSNCIIPVRKDILRKGLTWKKCTFWKSFPDNEPKVFSILATSFREHCQNCNFCEGWDTLTQKIFFGKLKIYSIILRVRAKKRLGKWRNSFRVLVNNAMNLSRWNIWGKMTFSKNL